MAVGLEGGERGRGFNGDGDASVERPVPLP